MGKDKPNLIIPHPNAADPKGYKMQYEFRGKTLQQAVRNSLYENAKVSLRRKDDAGERNTCRQLDKWIDDLKDDIDSVEKDIENIDKDLGRLKRSRNISAIAAAASAASAAAGPLASALRGAITVRKLLRGGGANLADVVSVIPVIGSAITAASGALAVAYYNRDIREAMRELDRISGILDATQGTLRELQNEWRQNRCDLHFS